MIPLNLEVPNATPHEVKDQVIMTEVIRSSWMKGREDLH